MNNVAYDISTSFWDQSTGVPLEPEHFSNIVTSAADLAIFLELTGQIRLVAVNPNNPDLGIIGHWANRNIREFLAADSTAKLDAKLDAFRSGDRTSLNAIEVNHSDNANWEVPISYTFHRTAQENVLLMLGRDLRPVAELQSRLVQAQLNLEKTYEAHRDYETRYKVVLEASRDPFVIVDAKTGRIIDLNSAGAHILGTDQNALKGGAFTQEFVGRKRSAFMESLTKSVSFSPVPAVTKRTAKDVAIHAKLFRSVFDQVLLCRIEATDVAQSVAEELSERLFNLYCRGAEAMLFTDMDGIITDANEAFLALCSATSLTDVIGTALDTYLARGSVDKSVLFDTARKAGKLRAYYTRLASLHGAQISVDISATYFKTQTASGYAFVIRDASSADFARFSAADSSQSPLAKNTMTNVIDLVGASPLKEIVSATTDVVEKICIETALDLTNNNRVAAADMLGLSRQSLYVKLHKHGLIGKETEA